MRQGRQGKGDGKNLTWATKAKAQHIHRERSQAQQVVLHREADCCFSETQTGKTCASDHTVRTKAETHGQSCDACPAVKGVLRHRDTGRNISDSDCGWQAQEHACFSQSHVHTLDQQPRHRELAKLYAQI